MFKNIVKFMGAILIFGGILVGASFGSDSAGPGNVPLPGNEIGGPGNVNLPTGSEKLD
ncbi:hypothetical protein M3626_20845 [Psychrobacillus sp. MER TA 17]|nr:hypothetical protein [Psychrobacillus sp. MER TA 17]